MRLQNRDKTKAELSRRYREVAHRVDLGIHTSEEADQFVMLIAHYFKYVTDSSLTNKFTKKLMEHREFANEDKALAAEAKMIIEGLKTSRDKLVRFGRRQQIDVGPFNFVTSGQIHQIAQDKEVSFNLHLLDGFLELPSEQQEPAQVPDAIRNLQSVIFSLAQLTKLSRGILLIQEEYKSLAADYERKLSSMGILVDYLRIQDYQALRLVWQEVYKVGDDDERVLFQLMYGDLFEKNRSYSNSQQQDADEFLSKYSNHLSRLHNHLLDRIEDVPARAILTAWIVEHFAPTLVSFLLIVLISVVLGLFGIHLGIDALQETLGV